MSFCLLLVLLLLTVVGYWLFGQDVLTPYLFYNIGFIACIIGVCIFQESWDYKPSFDVSLVIVMGSVTFLVSSYLIHSQLQLNRDTLKRQKPPQLKRLIPLNNELLFVYLIFQVVVAIFTLIEIDNMFPDCDLWTSIGQYDHISKFGTTSDIDISWENPLLGPMRSLASAGGFLVIYISAQELSIKQCGAKSGALLALNLAGLMFLLMEIGTRGVAINYGIGFIASYLVLSRHYLNERRVFTAKRAVATVLIVVIGLSAFEVSAIGRQSFDEDTSYLSLYIGAQVPNLDSFITENSLPTSDYFGQQTFSSSIAWLNKLSGSELFPPGPNTLRFRSSNGHNLGNVYTTYYDFLEDGGIFGLVFFVALMGAFSQFVYEKALLGLGDNRMLWVILYSMMSGPLIFSFFSCRYYTGFFNLVTLKTVVYILLLRWLYTKMHNFLNKNGYWAAHRHSSNGIR